MEVPAILITYVHDMNDNEGYELITCQTRLDTVSDLI